MSVSNLVMVVVESPLGIVFDFTFSVILKNLINEKSGSTYKLNAKLSFVKSSGSKAWTKEVVWAANFVPRVVWGARDPTGITDFQVKVIDFVQSDSIAFSVSK